MADFPPRLNAHAYSHLSRQNVDKLVQISAVAALKWRTEMLCYVSLSAEKRSEKLDRSNRDANFEELLKSVLSSAINVPVVVIMPPPEEHQRASSPPLPHGANRLPASAVLPGQRQHPRTTAAGLGPNKKATGGDWLYWYDMVERRRRCALFPNPLGEHIYEAEEPGAEATQMENPFKRPKSCNKSVNGRWHAWTDDHGHNIGFVTENVGDCQQAGIGKHAYILQSTRGATGWRVAIQSPAYTTGKHDPHRLSQLPPPVGDYEALGTIRTHPPSPQSPSEPQTVHSQHSTSLPPSISTTRSGSELTKIQLLEQCNLYSFVGLNPSMWKDFSDEAKVTIRRGQ